MKKQNRPLRHKKVVDETVKISDKQGNGVLKYSVSVDMQGKIARYSIAYINPHLFNADNGRVLGYDNRHGYHHRHYMGKEEMVEFISYEDIEQRFEKEWRAIHEKIKEQKKR